MDERGFFLDAVDILNLSNSLCPPTIWHLSSRIFILLPKSGIFIPLRNPPENSPFITSQKHLLLFGPVVLSAKNMRFNLRST
jgi:hypothetical protein